jgi:prephenate dehydrogenase
VNATSAFAPRTVVIHSVGLLGASLGLGLKASGFGGTIIGLSSQRAVDTALELGCIDEGHGYERLADVAREADLIVICSPILAIIECIKNLGTMKLREGVLVTDVGSTKRSIMETAAQCLPPHVRSEKSGPSAADPYLFQNAIYVLTPAAKATSDIDRQFAAFIEKYLGCRHVFLEAGVHDTIAATVSHVPHLLAVALVNLAKETDDRVAGTMQLAAGGFRDLTRIASAPFSMWSDILSTNKQAIAPVVDECIGILRSVKDELERDALKERFESAARARMLIPSDRKGFIKALHEVLVLAKDQPGVIATISQSLARHNINIKDIEVVKVREGEGGTIRLGFDSPETSERAIDILTKQGFSARERK